MMRDDTRGLRIADLVRDELASVIQREMQDPRIGLVSINEVRVSGDLAVADVYVSTMDMAAAVPSTAKGLAERQAALVGVLNGASGFFRSQLAKRLRLRATPKPRFHYDESVERGLHLERLIDQATAADQRGAHDG